MTVAEILDLLSKGGLLAGAIIIIVAFFTDRLFTRGYVQELRSEKHELVGIVRGFAGSNDRLSDLLEKALARLETIDQERRR